MHASDKSERALSARAAEIDFNYTFSPGATKCRPLYGPRRWFRWRGSARNCTNDDKGRGTGGVARKYD